MKKAILSPLCSAFVIPGLGQVINQHLKKGVLILAAVFVFFVVFVIRLYGIINAVMKEGAISLGDTSVIMDKLKAEDPPVLCILLMVFIILWAYSVLDAFLAGWKIDQLGEGDRL